MATGGMKTRGGRDENRGVVPGTGKRPEMRLPPLHDPGTLTGESAPHPTEEIFQFAFFSVPNPFSMALGHSREYGSAFYKAGT